MKSGYSEIEFKKEIGQRLKSAREFLKKSQKDIAVEFNVNQSTISQIENGINFPSFYIIWHYLKKYKISLDWLIHGHGTMQIQNQDIFSLIRRGEIVDNRYIELLKKMKDPDFEALIFASAIEAEIIVKLKENPNKS